METNEVIDFSKEHSESKNFKYKNACAVCKATWKYHAKCRIMYYVRAILIWKVFQWNIKMTFIIQFNLNGYTDVKIMISQEVINGTVTKVTSYQIMNV